MTDTIELNDLNFDVEVKKSGEPVLVDFFASWCGPCRMQSPIVEELAKDYSGKARIGKINVDDGRVKSAEFGVSTIPALLIFKNGQVVERLTGLHTKGQLSSALDKYL